MNKEGEQLLNKCDNCKLKECIGCEFTWADIQKIRKYIQELEQKESILDKVTETLKRDREIFDKCRKMHEMYSPSEERMNTKYYYVEKLLNIIEGEKE